MNSELREATRLWTRALPTVSAFVASLVRDFGDRDDVLQETAVAVLESFERYDPSQSFVGWAIGIARNQVRLHCRRKGRDRLSLDPEAIEVLASVFAEESPDDPRLGHLRTCLKKLDRKAHDLCRLRYEQDLKPAAIGEKLGAGANAVAKALQRIRDGLRECIERQVAAGGAST